jgi:glycosyltransferase 2 family protein
MKRGVLLALRLAVAISLLAFVLFIVPLPDIFAVLGSADQLLIALSFSLIVLDQYLGAIQMRPLAGTLNLSVTVNAILRINMISTFYQLFLAGSLSGGIARFYMLGNPDSRYSSAFACIVFSRLVENITLLVTGLICWWFGGALLGYRIGLLFLAMLLAFLSLYLLLFSRLPFLARLRLLAASLIERLPVSLGARLGGLSEQFRLAGEFPARSQAYVFAISFVRQAIGIFGFLCLARSILMPIGYLELGWVRSFVQLLSQIPISFAGLGVREGTLLGLLPLYGVSAPAAVALSFLLLARTLFLGILGGLVEARYRLVWRR